MKRRLQRAYDRMTMPDDCSQRIEKALQRELRKQKNMPKLPKDTSVRVIAPAPKKSSQWGMAAAAVLLVMLLSVGGVGLLLYGPEPASADPVSATSPQMTEMIVEPRETTPEGFYEMAAPDWTSAQVDERAEEIRQYVLDRNWDGLAMHLQYPFVMEGTTFQYESEFTAYMQLHEDSDAFRRAIEAESCRNMFCNTDDGIMMGAEGQIWLYQVEGGFLRIIAINGLVSDAQRYQYETQEDGSVCILRYLGEEENVAIPAWIDGKEVTRIGWVAVAGTGAFQDCSTIKTVTIPDSVTLIDDNAFSGCTNLETVYAGSGVTGVGNCAFEVCPNLKAVYFYGDAPDGGNYIFSESEQVTVYYNEPTNGWTEAWEGRPTAICRRGEYQGSRVFEELFMPMAEGILGNSEQEFREEAQSRGFEIIEENAVWLVYDPDVSGACMNAKPLYGDSGWIIDRAGYSVTVNGTLYHVKVENMASGSRTYATGNSIFAEGGTAVSSPAGFRDYLASQPDAALLDREAAHEKLAQILTGEGTFRVYDGDITIGEYFSQEMTEGVYGSASHCAVMDLDGNGTNEVLLRIVVGENNDAGTLILFSDGSEIRGEEKWYREMYQLKEDGTFLWSGGASDSGIGQIVFSDSQPVTEKIHWSMPDSENPDSMTYRRDGGLKSTEAEFNQLLAQQEAKKDVQWLAYPEEVRTAAADVLVQPVAEIHDQEAILDVMNQFGIAYFRRDLDTMDAFLPDGQAGIHVMTWGLEKKVDIIDYKGVPEGVQKVGARCNVSLEVLEEGQDSYSYLSMELVKQADGWKVASYGLEK